MIAFVDDHRETSRRADPPSCPSTSRAHHATSDAAIGARAKRSDTQARDRARVRQGIRGLWRAQCVAADDAEMPSGCTLRHSSTDARDKVGVTSWCARRSAKRRRHFPPVAFRWRCSHRICQNARCPKSANRHVAGHYQPAKGSDLGRRSAADGSAHRAMAFACLCCALSRLQSFRVVSLNDSAPGRVCSQIRDSLLCGSVG
ncbi:hypothetical protein SAMN06295912_12035 [Sphingomonas laterariae]|uniref:Uncharacterized protein n=1 Tax=Edaphosphingomonas laterariae TaxID=861865 RepID=A0A239I027_9SPHN|nr:hypothetical protein SAMN06295912_12035 [Sphingomonas laterariae]